jgi:hypothetical protein
MTQEALKLALEALELCNGAETVEGVVIYTNKEITAIKEALSQRTEQEPVGRFAKFTDGIWREVTDYSAGVPLYTHPPQRPWVGLKDEEAMQICVDCGCLSEDWMTLLDAIEAKLKERNT